MEMRLATIVPAVALLALAAPAGAHPGHEAGLAGGLIHPLGGADHLLAMVALGLLAGASGGRARLPCPLAFLASAALGFFAGPGALPWVEPIVLASVLVLGLLLAMAAPVGLGAGIVLAALTGLFHGQAHAAEAGSQAIGGFAAGFLIASATLNAAGLWLQRLAGKALARLAGAAAVLGGLALALA
jgi:urease accessory protein